MPCCRDSIGKLDLEKGSNAGLLLSRYLKEQKQDGNNKGEEAKKELLCAAVNAVNKSYDVYKTAFDRRKRFIEGEWKDFNLHGRMAIGLGAANVLEIGLVLNHIYGAPIIPGSALKGLAAHYCSSVFGESNPNFKGPKRDKNGKVLKRAGESYEFIFGKVYPPNSDDDKEEAGFIIFHDAWIKPESLYGSLRFDVMTPHHKEYYGGNAAPTDFDSPTPVSFLSVSGNFEIMVSCVGEGVGVGNEEDDVIKRKPESWEKFTLGILKEALSNVIFKEALPRYGIGGKTNSGYGIGELKI